MSAPRRDKPTPGLVWPTAGVGTWVAPKQFVGSNCTGGSDCATADTSQIGLTVTLDSGVYGCECSCHDEKRDRARKARRLEDRESPWWLAR